MEAYHIHLLTPIHLGKEILDRQQLFSGSQDELFQKCEQILQQLKLEFTDSPDSSFVMKMFCKDCRTITFITEGKMYNQFGMRLKSKLEQRRFSVN